MDETLKQTIDEMDYTQMLSLWRKAEIGSPYFQGEVGDYFLKVMEEKEKDLSPGTRVMKNKWVGW